MGSLLADAIAGNQNEWLDIISRKPAYLPPDPFRWVGIQGLLGVVNAIDGYIDRRVSTQN